MNYILQLKEEIRSLKSNCASAQNEIDCFIKFLHSNKFTGVQSDGSRKDWILTADVILAIKEIKRLVPDVREIR